MVGPSSLRRTTTAGGELTADKNGPAQVMVDLETMEEL